MTAAVIIFAASSVMAQQASISDAEVTSRINHIQNVLDAGQTAANVWWWGWLAGYGALTVGQMGVYYGVDDRELRQDMVVGAATTFLGMVGQVIDDMEPGYLPDRLRLMPGDTPEQRRQKLASAEEFLRLCAQREIDGRSWYTHALAFVVNAGAGLFTWLYFERPFLDGLINFAIGQAISEIQIFTQPTRAIRDFQDYERRYNAVQSFNNRGSDDWYFAVFPGGFVAGYRF